MAGLLSGGGVQTASFAARKQPLILYSTNTYLKFRIQQNYLGQHHAWCSPVFDATKLGHYEIGAGQPPSADPSSIYRTLARAVKDGDEHDAKIAAQKSTISALAIAWSEARQITEAQRDEIIAVVNRASFREWRPLLFVIPCEPLAKRVKDVPREKRASSEPEYIIEDLNPSEFDIIELPT